MTVRVYLSTDDSAPSLTGQAGSLITVLDAVLVNGYGSRIAAGWAKAFSGTNKAAYRPPAISASPSEGNRFYLRVDDSGTTTAGVRGYESMSDVDTGSNPFPTTGQISNPGLVCQKSITADSTVRSWAAVATESFLYFIPQSAVSYLGTVSDYDSVVMFGDIHSYLSGDVYGTILVARTTSGTADPTFPNLQNSGGFVAHAGHYIARAYSGSAGAVGFSKTMKLGAAYQSRGSLFGFFDPLMNAYPIGRMFVKEQGTTSSYGTIRGYIPGLFGIYASPNERFKFCTGDIIPSSFLPGRRFMAVRTGAYAGFIEVTDNW